MFWRRAAGAYAAWLAAHLVAGAAFAATNVAIGPMPWHTLWVPGLLAGALYGAGQWLILERLFGRMSAWLIATVIASPFSWELASWIGFFTVVVGGWIGAGLSSGAQAIVIGARFASERRALSIATGWIFASLFGSAIFYFAYFGALRSQTWTSFALIVVGSAGYAIATGVVIAGVAGFRLNPAKSEPSSAERRS